MSGRTHYHRTIGEAGQCASCRASNIELISDSPRRYLLGFPDANHVSAIALVPGFNFDNAVDNAWATGCNPGGRVTGGQELTIEQAERAAVPVCVLLEDGAALAALDALDALDAACRDLHD
jgi:hypothetical protein